MTNGEKLLAFQKELIKVLQKKDFSWQEFAPSREYLNSRRFQYEDKIAVEFSYANDLWIHVWVSKSIADADFALPHSRRFTGHPRSLKIQWNKSARDTAHNVAAILCLLAYGIENTLTTIVE